MEAGETVASPAPLVTAPRCHRHPADPEADDCDRCGAFACDLCLKYLEDKYLCVDCISRELRELPHLEGRAQAATANLLLIALADVAWFGMMLAGRPHEGAPITDADVVRVWLGFFPSLWLFVSGVFFLRWYALVIRVANRLGVGPGVTSFYAVGVWFLPYVSWVRPFDHVRSILKQLGRASPAVDIWHLSWIGLNVLSLVAYRRLNPQLELAAHAIDLAGAIFATVVVLRLTRALSVRRSTDAAVVTA